MKNILQGLFNNNQLISLEFDNSSIAIVNKDTIKFEDGGVLLEDYSTNGVRYYTFKPYGVIKGIAIVGDGYSIEDYKYKRL